MPPFIITFTFPSTYGVYVLLPSPPPKTLPWIIPLFTITVVLLEDAFVVDSPLTTPNALPPYTLPNIFKVELSLPIVTLLASLTKV